MPPCVVYLRMAYSQYVHRVYLRVCIARYASMCVCIARYASLYAQVGMYLPVCLPVCQIGVHLPYIASLYTLDPSVSPRVHSGDDSYSRVVEGESLPP